jgi:hypothetical protein
MPVWITVRQPVISYSDFRGRLTTLEQGGHRFELTQKITAQFQIRVFF